MHGPRARCHRSIAWIGLGLITIFSLSGCEKGEPEPTKSFESAYEPQPPPPPPPLPEVGAAVREALLVPDRLARVERLASLLRSLGPEAIEPVREAYDATFLDVGDVELTLFIEWWVPLDLPGARDYVLSHWTTRSSEVAIILMRAVARQDPSQALPLIPGMAMGGLREHALLGTVQGWDESGKPGLVDFLAQLPVVERQLSAAILVRRHVLQYGVDETIRWAEAVPDPKLPRETLKQEILQRLATAITEVDPQKAAAFAERHHKGKFDFGMLRNVSGLWAQRDPLATMAWLSTVEPRGKQYDAAVFAAYQNWAMADRKAAEAWVRETTLAPWLDPALQAFVFSIVAANPQDAASWAEKISRPELRHETLYKVGQIWFKQDPEATETWLASQDFSNTELAFIRSK